jgi:predicted Zn-dependent protease
VQGESFVSVQKRLIETLQKEQRWLQAGIAAGVLFDALPNQHQPARVASLLLLRANALPLAHYYAKQAVKLNPQNSNYKLSLAEILFKSNQLRAAINMLDEVIAQDPNNLKAKQIKRSIGG